MSGLLRESQGFAAVAAQHQQAPEDEEDEEEVAQRS
jgi:hypothetical protein